MNLYGSLDELPSDIKIQIESPVRELESQGITCELNYLVMLNALNLLRHMRGFLMAGLDAVLDMKRMKGCDYYTASRMFYDSQKDRSFEEHRQLIDKVSSDAAVLATEAGALFNIPALEKNDSRYTRFIDLFHSMSAYDKSQPHCIYHNYQIIYLLGDLYTRNYRGILCRGDDLGIHLASSEPNHFLSGISVSNLDIYNTVALAPAASSALLESGIFADYMKTRLGINTEIDPVFLSADAPVSVMGSMQYPGNVVAIPYDDAILGRGYSPVLTRRAVHNKYGSKMYANWNMLALPDGIVR